MSRRPTLLSSCARAATTAEARFRIDAPGQTARATRVVALDKNAAAVVRPLPEEPWRGARFLHYEHREEIAGLADISLITPDGGPVWLSEELADADFVMMIATTGDGAGAAAVIGGACGTRGIMTAGVALGEGAEVAAAVTALRPHARVLLVSRDQQDVSAVLTAVGA
jgi:hypothetical protein